MKLPSLILLGIVAASIALLKADIASAAPSGRKPKTNEWNVHSDNESIIFEDIPDSDNNVESDNDSSSTLSSAPRAAYERYLQNRQKKHSLAPIEENEAIIFEDFPESDNNAESDNDLSSTVSSTHGAAYERYLQDRKAQKERMEAIEYLSVLDGISDSEMM